MTSLRVRNGWVGRLMALLGSLLLLTACSTTTTVVATPPVPAPQSEDDDFSQLIAQLRADLNRNTTRAGATQKPLAASTTADGRKERDRAFSARANALFAPLNGTGLHMPVVGITSRNLYDSWHQPRDGGRRKHKGIDIFAPRGTGVVAVTSGIISYIGDQPKGGLCLWLTNEEGQSFYYAHLDRWAPGLYEGMEVESGDLLGYVGNTGNAKSTPPHLHFAINDNDEMVNPYPILTRASVVRRARVTHESGNALGTR
jgi:peptidoglycan LD-endopeptidase LytH